MPRRLRPHPQSRRGILLPGGRSVQRPFGAVVDLSCSAGWSSSVARWAHNPEVVGSNPAPATRSKGPVSKEAGPLSVNRPVTSLSACEVSRHGLCPVPGGRKRNGSKAVCCEEVRRVVRQATRGDPGDSRPGRAERPGTPDASDVARQPGLGATLRSARKLPEGEVFRDGDFCGAAGKVIADDEERSLPHWSGVRRAENVRLRRRAETTQIEDSSICGSGSCSGFCAGSAVLPEPAIDISTRAARVQGPCRCKPPRRRLATPRPRRRRFTNHRRSEGCVSWLPTTRKLSTDAAMSDPILCSRLLPCSA